MVFMNVVIVTFNWLVLRRRATAPSCCRLGKALTAAQKSVVATLQSLLIDSAKLFGYDIEYPDSLHVSWI